MRCVNHPNIVKYYDHFAVDPKKLPKKSKEDREKEEQEKLKGKKFEAWTEEDKKKHPYEYQEAMYQKSLFKAGLDPVTETSSDSDQQKGAVGGRVRKPEWAVSDSSFDDPVPEWARSDTDSSGAGGAGLVLKMPGSSSLSGAEWEGMGSGSKHSGKSSGGSLGFEERLPMGTSFKADVDDRHLSRVRYYILMEFCTAGSLATEMTRYPNNLMPESGARYYFKQIGSGLNYMHSKGITHNDLHIMNVLVTYLPDGMTKKAVIGDLGKARMRMKKLNPYYDINQLVGILEQLLSGKEHAYEVDLSELSDSLSKLLNDFRKIERSRGVTVEKILSHGWVKGETVAPVPPGSSGRITSPQRAASPQHRALSPEARRIRPGRARPVAAPQVIQEESEPTDSDAPSRRYAPTPAEMRHGPWKSEGRGLQPDKKRDSYAHELAKYSAVPGVESYARGGSESPLSDPGVGHSGRPASPATPVTPRRNRSAAGGSQRRSSSSSSSSSNGSPPRPGRAGRGRRSRERSRSSPVQKSDQRRRSSSPGHKRRRSPRRSL